MKKQILFVVFQILFSQVNLHAFWGIYDPVRNPKIGECFPSDPFSKKYVHSEKTLLYIRKVFTCEYICVHSDHSTETLTGTSDKKDWLNENGRTFVCEGYAENMVYVETPNNPKSWGYWSLRGSTPFYPMKRDIPELKVWFHQNIKNPSLEMLFNSPPPALPYSEQDY